MPANFIMVDRATPMLFPPDMRDLVPEDDMVYFVIEAVERLPSDTFDVNERRVATSQCVT